MIQIIQRNVYQNYDLFISLKKQIDTNEEYIKRK